MRSDGRRSPRASRPFPSGQLVGESCMKPLLAGTRYSRGHFRTYECVSVACLRCDVLFAATCHAYFPWQLHRPFLSTSYMSRFRRKPTAIKSDSAVSVYCIHSATAHCTTVISSICALFNPLCISSTCSLSLDRRMGARRRHVAQRSLGSRTARNSQPRSKYTHTLTHLS